jgi:hypothetical protein
MFARIVGHAFNLYTVAMVGIAGVAFTLGVASMLIPTQVNGFLIALFG